MRSVVALLCLLAGPALGQDRAITGTAIVRERIALPADMVLAVEARGPLGAGVAEDWIDGGAVTDFALTVPAGLGVEIRLALIGLGDDDTGIAFTAGPVAVPAGTEDVALGDLPLARHDMVAFRLYLDCGGRRVGVGVAPGQAGDAVVVDIDGDRMALAPVPVASGLKYGLADDPGTWLWNKGEEVALSLGGEVADCAPVPGVSWRARGDGWSIVLTGDQVDFRSRAAWVLTRGAEETEGDFRPPVWSEGAAMLAAVDGGPAMRVQPASCALGGLTFPHSVEIAMGDGILTGCGGDPAGLLTGAEWAVEDIGGGGIIDGAHVTIAFAADGTASGSGGCNRWSGTWALADGLTFGPAAATRMACAEALMTLEQRFFDALARTAGFRIDGTGALVLTDAQGADLLTARR